jgi:hypothetical protein
MANREGSSDAQRPGLDKDFQGGLAQVQSLKSTEFANSRCQEKVRLFQAR